MIYIIGCGGVGSWLTPTLCMLEKNPKSVCIIDGDTLEEKNLDRQLFTNKDIGKSKAEALSLKYKCNHIHGWYSETSIEAKREDWIICVVDNHPARKSALIASDIYGCRVICAANETLSSEAFYYEPDWFKTSLDPRIYYPEIMTVSENDPRRATIGCTGEAQVENPQLVTANFMAAALAAHLFVVWDKEAQKLPEDSRKFLPYKLVNNMSKNETYKVSDAQKTK